MDTEKVEEIINKNDELYNDLQSAFDSAGVGASINRETGEIALDSLVLFSSESSDVSDEGKDFINRFLTAYTSVIFNEKYDGFIKTITVEGHTDTNGSYEYNQKLSQERADNVKNYCLTGESGLDEAALGKLGNMLEAVGYAYDKPILNEDGTVNMGASRRVSFKFIINLEQ
ncbi:MAG: OmpA family protein [Ruminococcus sp.]|nr:OmpA family protein [Ruminococcus sp.]